MNQKQLLKFEVMDRAFIQMEQFYNTFEYHHGLTNKTRKKVDKINKLLHELYQQASEEFDKCIQ